MRLALLAVFSGVVLFAVGCAGCGVTTIKCQDFTDCPNGQLCVKGECRATNATTGSGPGGGGTGAGTSGGGTGAGTSGGGTGAGTTGGGNPCPSTCSDDLQASVDCMGVRTACPAGTGCAPTGCIDPCQAAAAAGSTIGCDFYAASVPPQTETIGSCYAVLVANTWNAPVTLTVSHGSTMLNVSSLARIPRNNGGTLTYDPLPMGVLPQGEMAILFLAQDDVNGGSAIYYTPCPITPALQTPFQLDGTGFTSSFHISSTAPVVAYDMYPYGGANSHVTSTSLLIPTSAWGTNYVGATPTGPLSIFNPYLQLYGSEDNTQIAIQAPVAIQGGSGVMGAAANTVARYTLNKGQVLQLSQPQQLSGAFVRSDKPIAVWGGHVCMNLPDGIAACDSGHQQFPAVPLLGNEYLAVRHKERNAGANEAAMWRFVGAVDGTTLTFDPPVGGPATLAAGQSVTFSHPGPFRVFSQDSAHIFYVAQMMTGGEANNDHGDPEFVNLVPPQQFLRSYLFLTDPTYTTTDLVFVRPLASDNTYHDVSLDCFGVLGPWFGIGGTNYQYSRVSWARAGTGNCSNGAHKAFSTAPFGLTVWGVDEYTSYGYPAGMSVRPINTVVVGPEIN
ncbi:MAG: IgGFc-binding protein [Archangium sp.]|nr:IgGFc-binding protein [Archangium sp.]